MKDIYDVINNYNFYYNDKSVYVLNYKNYVITISINYNSNYTYNFSIIKKNKMDNFQLKLQNGIKPYDVIINVIIEEKSNVDIYNIKKIVEELNKILISKLRKNKILKII
jgi:hypothetical protein